MISFLRFFSIKRLWLKSALLAVFVLSLLIFVANQQGLSGQKDQSTISPSVKRVIIIGDISCPKDQKVTATECRTRDVIAKVKAAKPDAVLLPGDIQYSKGTDKEFNDAFKPLWEDIKAITYAVPGNHEYGTKDAEGYFNYWNGKEKYSINAGETGKGYYNFSINGWDIFALNSNCDAVGGCGYNSPQGRWLSDKISSTTSKCQLAFWHHPVFSSGFHNADAADSNAGTDFLRLLEIIKTDVVINGHEHFYESMLPVDHTGRKNGTYGIRQFIVGTGGRSLHPFKTIAPQHSAGFSEFGYLELELKSEEYSWKFINLNDKILDSGTDRCR
jgi:acid phosphatase type 7